jgi:hypothetical protein
METMEPGQSDQPVAGFRKRPGDGDDWRLIDDPTEEEFAAVKAHANPEQRELIEVLCAAIAPVLKELIEPLREKIAELENRPHVQYRGVWKEGQPYGTGSMVTHEGSVWHANRATMQRPGAGDDWTLAVRRGRDAK